MIDIEKVIKGLEACIIDDNEPCRCPYDGDGGCIGSLMRDVIVLLKAREPLEPVMVNGEPECAECRYELRRDADSYCPCCGRKVKWPCD